MRLFNHLLFIKIFIYMFFVVFYLYFCVSFVRIYKYKYIYIAKLLV